MKALVRFRGCSGWSEPLLFAYGRNMFSHGVAQIKNNNNNNNNNNNKKKKTKKKQKQKTNKQKKQKQKKKKKKKNKKKKGKKKKRQNKKNKQKTKQNKNKTTTTKNKTKKNKIKKKNPLHLRFTFASFLPMLHIYNKSSLSLWHGAQPPTPHSKVKFSNPVIPETYQISRSTTKPTKCRGPSEDADQSGHSPSLCCAL